MMLQSGTLATMLQGFCYGIDSRLGSLVLVRQPVMKGKLGSLVLVRQPVMKGKLGSLVLVRQSVMKEGKL